MIVRGEKRSANRTTWANRPDEGGHQENDHAKDKNLEDVAIDASELVRAAIRISWYFLHGKTSIESISLVVRYGRQHMIFNQCLPSSTAQWLTTSGRFKPPFALNGSDLTTFKDQLAMDTETGGGRPWTM